MLTTKKPTLYLDLDGVLADFNLAAKRLLGSTDEEQAAADRQGRWPSEQWQKIIDHEHFYLDLPKMPGADDMVALALKFRSYLDYEVKILSAIPKDNDMPAAFEDKLRWVDRYYGDLAIPVRFGPYSHDKQKHCGSSQDILVDDRTSNCDQWRAQGGQAVQVRAGRYRTALAQLERLFQDLRSRQAAG